MKMTKLSETQIQQHCVKLLNSFARQDIEWHHCPNGEKRSKKTAQRLKSLGVQPGVADLLFLINTRSWALELKTNTGVQSKAQADYQERFERAGGTYKIAFGLEQAVSALINLDVFKPNIHISLNALLK
jgi:hypothetical protein